MSAASLQAPVIFTIAQDLAKMEVHTNVAESDIGRLKSGMRVSFTVDDQNRATDALGQLACVLRLHLRRQMSQRERLASRFEAPADAVFDRLRRMRLRKHLREEEL
jgi:hypothetical protein